MKLNLSIISLLLFLTTSISHADDYVWGEEFKEGDVISAATFNQIFDTIQKLNRTPKDSDLVGTWNCDAVHSQSGLDTSGWVTNDFILILSNAQLTMTASSQSTSLAQSYTYSTSHPSPFIRFGTHEISGYTGTLGGNVATYGTYILFNDMLLMKGVMSASAVSKYQVNIISDDRFILTPLSDGGNYSDLIMCDSATAVPAAPTETTVTNAQTLLNITWTDQSSDETGFNIYRRLSNEAEATLLTTAVTASPYSDSTLSEGQTAFYSVSAYNDNGESAKSKVVSTTLDGVKPTVVSHIPTANQQVATSNTTISITFSEDITILCSGDYSYCGDGQGILVTSAKSGSQTYANFKMGPIYKLVYSGSNSEIFDGNDTITVTVRKDFIKDAFGNYMNEDYVYTFTTGP